MRFRQISTGAIINVKNEDAVRIMASSPHYERIADKPAKAETPKPKPKGRGSKKK